MDKNIQTELLVVSIFTYESRSFHAYESQRFLFLIHVIN